MDSGTRNAGGATGTEFSVLEKAFQILETFRGRDRGLSLKEITERTQLPKPTVHRICTRLVRLGALVRTETGFQLGMALFKLGSRVPYARTIREISLPFLGDLHDIARETVHLGLLEGTRVTLIEKVSDGRGIPLPSRIGGSMPPHSTALGKAVLAFSPPDVIEGALARELTRQSPFTVTDREAVRRELATIAERGYALDREEARIGINCVAAPLRGRSGHAFGGISITGPTGRFDPERMAHALCTTANTVSRELRNRAVDLIVHDPIDDAL